MKKRKLDILYEDKHLIIVNKNGNMPTIKCDNYKDNLYSEVFDYLNKKVFVVHRLDKDTSGIVVFAKSERVKESLQNTWDYTERNYIAVVHGITKDKDTIKSYLKETKTLYTYSTNDKSGKYAETSYVRVKSNKQYSLLKINIKTGRKNQIRVHMKYINHPIINDPVYGNKKSVSSFGQMLHAKKISFVHPITNKIMTFTCDEPEEFDKIKDKYKNE